MSGNLSSCRFCEGGGPLLVDLPLEDLSNWVLSSAAMLADMLASI
jgi:hypothetical protein